MAAATAAPAPKIVARFKNSRREIQPSRQNMLDEIDAKVDMHKLEAKLMEEGIEKFASPQSGPQRAEYPWVPFGKVLAGRVDQMCCFVARQWIDAGLRLVAAAKVLAQRERRICGQILVLYGL